MPHCDGGSSAHPIFGAVTMPGVPGKNHWRVVAAFGKIGYRVARESDHIIMSNGTVQPKIPRHNPVNAYTMDGLVAQAGLTREQFEELY